LSEHRRRCLSFHIAVKALPRRSRLLAGPPFTTHCIWPHVSCQIYEVIYDDTMVARQRLWFSAVTTRGQQVCPGWFVTDPVTPWPCCHPPRENVASCHSVHIHVCTQCVGLRQPPHPLQPSRECTARLRQWRANVAYTIEKTPVDRRVSVIPPPSCTCYRPVAEADKPISHSNMMLSHSNTMLWTGHACHPSPHHH